MAWTIPANVVSGTQIQAATTNAILADLTVIGGAWTTYVPTLTNITLGNGTVLAAYKQVGDKTTLVRFAFAAGSTTTYGAGALGVSLPPGVTPHADYTGTLVNNWAVGKGIANATGTRQTITAIIASTGIVNFILDSATASTPVTNTVPGTWTTTSLLTFTLELEAA